MLDSKSLVVYLKKYLKQLKTLTELKIDNNMTCDMIFNNVAF